METTEKEQETATFTLPRVLEAILVASPEPLSVEELVSMVRGAARSARSEERKRIEEELGAKMGGGDDEDAEDVGEEAKAKAKGKKDKAGKKKSKGKKAKAKAKDEDADAEAEEEVDVSGVRDALRKAQAARPEMAFAKVTAEAVEEALAALVAEYDAGGVAFTVLERAEGWKIFTRADYAGWVKQLFPEKKPERLSGPALETLSIIAYRQPITKSAMEAVRGVSCDGVLQKLLDRNIVRIAGRAELPGRPLLYETTEVFFEHFGIRSVDDLPNAAELRTVELPEPEAEKEEEEAKEGDEATDEGEEATEGEGGNDEGEAAEAEEATDAADGGGEGDGDEAIEEGGEDGEGADGEAVEEGEYGEEKPE